MQQPALTLHYNILAASCLKNTLTELVKSQNNFYCNSPVVEISDVPVFKMHRDCATLHIYQKLHLKRLAIGNDLQGQSSQLLLLDKPYITSS